MYDQHRRAACINRVSIAVATACVALVLGTGSAWADEVAAGDDLQPVSSEQVAEPVDDGIAEAGVDAAEAVEPDSSIGEGFTDEVSADESAAEGAADKSIIGEGTAEGDATDDGSIGEVPAADESGVGADGAGDAEGLIDEAAAADADAVDDGTAADDAEAEDMAAEDASIEGVAGESAAVDAESEQPESTDDAAAADAEQASDNATEPTQTAPVKPTGTTATPTKQAEAPQAQASQTEDPAKRTMAETAAQKQQRAQNLAASNKGGTLVKNGIYAIQTALKNNTVFGINVGSKSVGTIVQLGTSTMNASQMWRVIVDSQGFITLTNLHSNLVLDLKDGNTNSGAAVVMGRPNDSLTQKWALVKSGSGYMLVSAVDPDVVLDLTGGKSTAGTALQLGASSGANSQTWLFWNKESSSEKPVKTVASGNLYTVTASSGGLALDIKGGSFTSGTNATTGKVSYGLSQAWRFEQQSDGYYTITSTKGDMALEAWNGNVVPGAPVGLSVRNDKLAEQRWEIRSAGSGAYYIVNAATGLALSSGTSSGSSMTLVTTDKAGTWKIGQASLQIAEGCYRVNSATSAKQVLDVTKSGASAGLAEDVWKWDGTMDQTWWLRKSSTGVYTLQPTSSGLFLTDNGGTITQEAKSGKNSQWRLSYADNTGYELVNVATGRALQVNGSFGASSGKNTGARTQAWTFTKVTNPVPEGFYTVQNEAKGMYLSIPGSSMAEYANVNVAAGSGGLNQTFWLRTLGGGEYSITAGCSAKAVYVRGSSTSAGANIQQGEYDTSYKSERWRFAMTDSGLQIVSSLGTTMAVSGTGTSGSNVETAKSANSDTQAWHLTQVNKPGKIGYQNPNGYYQMSAYRVRVNGHGTSFGYTSPVTISYDATRDEVIEAFIARAYDYIGTPYVWDYARQPGVGVDCIGLVMQCCYAVGMDLGEFNPYLHYYTGPDGWHSHDANNMWDYGNIERLPLSERQRGDLISWNGHVAIYLGNDMMIEANGADVHVCSLWSLGTPRGVMRLFQ